MFNIVKINKNRFKLYFTFIRKIHNVDLSDIPKLAVANIRKVLRQKGFAVQDGFTSLTTKCTICTEEKVEQKKVDNKLYVNKTTGKEFFIIVYNSFYVSVLYLIKCTLFNFLRLFHMS